MELGPTFPGNFSQFGQMNPAVRHFTENAISFMGDHGDEISAGLGIIISLEADGLAVTEDGRHYVSLQCWCLVRGDRRHNILCPYPHKSRATSSNPRAANFSGRGRPLTGSQPRAA